jgi:protein-export membrane protein SecD
MRRETGGWLLVIAAITILVIYVIWPAWPGGTHPGLFGRALEVRPGLDIQGGLRVLLEAESAQPVTSDQMDQVRTIIERRVNSLGVAEAVVQRAGQNRIIIELPGVSDPQAAIDLVQQTALLEFVDFGKPPGCTAEYPAAGQYIRTDRQVAQGLSPSASATATTAASATIAATATTPATAEVTAAATIAATAEATALATEAATAEATADATTAAIPRAMMRPAQSTPAPTEAATTEPTTAPTVAATSEPTAAVTAEATTAATAEATAEATATVAAPGTKSNPLINPCTGQPFRTVMTGAGLSSADAGVRSGSTDYVVDFQLAGNNEAQAFASHTAANIGKQMAIVLDGEVLSAPTIQAALTTGGQITGGFTRDQAVALSVQLRSGALPVSLKIESTEQVGASLGAQSVEASVRAGIIGVIGVFLFMLIYYRWAGLSAVLALLLFCGINFALYKYIPVTLTLSAITGFLISIGTAVDGNILVFERMKEEIRAGRSTIKAIEIGFDRAWPSIRESNISTILIALVLYFFGGQFGASAVRGFAVTLILGLITNLFTAIVVTRTFLNVLVALRGERANNLKLFGE